MWLCRLKKQDRVFNFHQTIGIHTFIRKFVYFFSENENIIIMGIKKVVQIGSREIFKKH